MEKEANMVHIIKLDGENTHKEITKFDGKKYNVKDD